MLFAVGVCLSTATDSYSQVPFRIEELDGSPGRTYPTHLIVPNGTLTISGGRVTLDLSSLGGGTVSNTGDLTAGRLVVGNGTTDVTISLFTLAGPTVARTFTFPDANATVLTTNAAVTVAQGGTGAATLTGLLQGNGTSAFTAISNSSTVGQVLRVTGASAYGWGALNLADGDAVTGVLPGANFATGTPDGTKFLRDDQVWAAVPGSGIPTTITVADTTDSTSFVALFESATGDLAPKTDGAITYNASTGALTATSFVGNLTGAVTGNASTATALETARTIGGTSFDGTANIVPASITVVDSTDASSSIAIFDSATGDLQPKTDAGLTYNATTGTLTATAFSGPLTGNVTGNVSGTAATVTTAAQPAITSLGTLTALDVDNININGNTISSTAGTDLLITPLAGQQIVLDGTIIIDAGVVTGVTDITVADITISGTCTGCPGAGSIGGSTGATDNAILRADGTGGATVQSSGVTIDDSNNISTPGTITSGAGGSNAGVLTFTEGTAPSAAAANTIQLQAPTDVTTAYDLILPAASTTGFLLNTDSSNVGTLSIVASSGTGNVARTNSPTFVTPALGAATATTINGLTITSSTGTLTVTNGKTLSASNTLTLAGSDSTTITFQGTDTYVGRATTDTLTNKTIDSAATGNAITLSGKWWLPAAGGTAAVPGLLWDTLAANAPTAACSAGGTETTKLRCTADFADADGDVSLQQGIMLPADWSGDVDVKFVWRAAATTGDAVWQITTSCRADGEVDDAAFSTASTVTDTTKGTANQLNTATLTIGTGNAMATCAAGEYAHFKIFRNRTHASDTITGTISLVGVELTPRRTQ